MKFKKELLERYPISAYQKCSISSRLKRDQVFSRTSDIVKHLDELYEQSKIDNNDVNLDIYTINSIGELMVQFLRECISTLNDKKSIESFFDSIAYGKTCIESMQLNFAAGEKVNECIKEELISFSDKCFKYATGFDSDKFTVDTINAFTNIAISYYKILAQLYRIASNRSGDEYFCYMYGIYKELETITIEEAEAAHII